MVEGKLLSLPLERYSVFLITGTIIFCWPPFSCWVAGFLIIFQSNVKFFQSTLVIKVRQVTTAGSGCPPRAPACGWGGRHEQEHAGKLVLQGRENEKVPICSTS